MSPRYIGTEEIDEFEGLGEVIWNRKGQGDKVYILRRAAQTMGLKHLGSWESDPDYVRVEVSECKKRLSEHEIDLCRQRRAKARSSMIEGPNDTFYIKKGFASKFPRLSDFPRAEAYPDWIRVHRSVCERERVPTYLLYDEEAAQDRSQQSLRRRSQNHSHDTPGGSSHPYQATQLPKYRTSASLHYRDAFQNVASDPHSSRLPSTGSRRHIYDAISRPSSAGQPVRESYSGKVRHRDDPPYFVYGHGGSSR